MLSTLVAALSNDFAHMRMLHATTQSACTAETCWGRPAACPPAATPGLGSSRPSSGAQNHTITFHNAAPRSVTLVWVQPNSTARAFTTLAPDERKAVRSFTGDVWQARSEAPSHLLMEYVVGPVDVRDCACGDLPLVICPPRQPGKHDPSSRPSYEPAGFVNRAGTVVDVYVVGAQCETKLSSLEPGQQVHFASWAGQKFRVRRADDTRLLLQQSLGEVDIHECGQPQPQPLPEGSSHATALPGPQGGLAAGGGAAAVEARLAQLAADHLEHKRWARQMLERLATAVVKERQQRDLERAQLQGRVERLERLLAAVAARMDVTPGSGANATADDAPAPATAEAAAEPAEPEGESRSTTVEVDATGSTRWTASYQEL